MPRTTATSCKSHGRLAVGLTSTALLALLGVVGCGGGGGDSSSGTGLPTGKAVPAQVERGRYLVTTMGCVDCHSQGVNNPASATWMAGYVQGGNTGIFQIGPFTTYCPNLTPDAATGIGSLTDRQIYNALKHGLDPGETPDVVISGDVPGQGNFPAQPHYLAPPMPWYSTRHLTDGDLWSLVAYLKHGIKPVSNTVPDSQGPPDDWASSYTSDKIGPVTLPSYPASGEQFTP